MRQHGARVAAATWVSTRTALHVVPAAGRQLHQELFTALVNFDTPRYRQLP